MKTSGESILTSGTKMLTAFFIYFYPSEKYEQEKYKTKD